MAHPNQPDPEDDLSRARHLFGDLGMDAPLQEAANALTPDHQIERLFEISRQVHGTLDIDELLPRIVELAVRNAHADRGILFHFDERTGASHPWATYGVEPEDIEELGTYSRTLLDGARLRESIHSADASSDPRFKNVESVTLNEIRSIICVPIATSERVMGALYLDNRQSQRRIDEQAMRFTSILAGLSAVAIDNAERYKTLSRRNAQLTRELQRYSDYDAIVGRSQPMVELLRKLDRVATTDFPVLLSGESGTGKELVARAVHRASLRSQMPFVVQNCAAIPRDLLESEFFGHVRGAFTGAHASKEGLFQVAEGGTLFLDEIGDLDMQLQAKLLRVLEDGMVRAVGASTEQKVDVRLVSATSVDIRKAVSEGRFRQDLYYRLNVVTLQVPPLRERRADIPILISHFVERHRSKVRHQAPQLTQKALRFLQQLPWKGNVRELEHFVKRLLILSDGSSIDVSDLQRLLDLDADESTVQIPIGEMTLKEIETWAIREALKRTDGNKAQAASMLGLHRNALLRRLQKLDENGEEE